MAVALIVAVAENDVIGRLGVQLPWRLKADLAHFKQVTMGHTVVMGRSTYETLKKPLPGRDNVIVSRQLDFTAPGFTVVHTLDRALALPSRDGDTFVIGGGSVYEQALPFVTKIYLTRVHANPLGDVYFKFDMSDWDEESRERHEADENNEFPYSFITLTRRDHAA